MLPIYHFFSTLIPDNGPFQSCVQEGYVMKLPHGKVMKINPKKDSWGSYTNGRPPSRFWAKLPHLVVFLTCIILLGVTIQM